MLANDMKKGMRVRLRNGWYGTVADNAKGNIRMVTVEGYHTETGSVYTHDIALVSRKDGATDDTSTWESVTMSPAQIKNAETIRRMGF